MIHRGAANRLRVHIKAERRRAAGIPRFEKCNARIKITRAFGLYCETGKTVGAYSGDDLVAPVGRNCPYEADTLDAGVKLGQTEAVDIGVEFIRSYFA
jgi:hypothetical protein